MAGVTNESGTPHLPHGRMWHGGDIDHRTLAFVAYRLCGLIWCHSVTRKLTVCDVLLWGSRS